MTVPTPTDNMRAVLREALHDEDPHFYVDGCVMPGMQKALARRGYIEQVNGRWRVTDAARNIDWPKS